MLERQNALLKRKLAKYESEGEAAESGEEEMEKIERFMNNHENELSVTNTSQAKRYFKKMKDLYHSKLNQYVQELTFISEKLTRYDQIVLERQRNRVY